MSQPHFDPEAYWGPREFKKWVVLVARYRGFKAQYAETKYVRARTEEDACRIALRESCVPGRLTASARLAYPHDLGIV